MRKRVEPWLVKDLRVNFPLIDFPEYQREPNLWSLTEKQRLIDSMSRQFDIASIYLYRHKDGTIDCVDGRQRIGAIMSFIGENPSDVQHNSFTYKQINEIYEEDGQRFHSLAGKTFSEIKDFHKNFSNEDAKDFIDSFMNYPITVVMLSESEASNEFNLQFTRLNLGTIINSGEKLHAMVGDLRDICFNTLGKHPFLEDTNIPTRRFAREQVAAQIIAQIFSKNDSNEYTRTRHFDLQRLFKQNNRLIEEREQIIKDIGILFDLLEPAFKNKNILRNRAITVSTVLLAKESEIESSKQAQELADFVEEFVLRLTWQIKKGLDIDQEYRYLVEFQRSITQASAEKPGVTLRVRILDEEYRRWLDTNELKGDPEWKVAHPHLNPSRESRYSR